MCTEVEKVREINLCRDGLVLSSRQFGRDERSLARKSVKKEGLCHSRSKAHNYYNAMHHVVFSTCFAGSGHVGTAQW